MIYSVVSLVVMVGAGLVLGWQPHGGIAETMAALGLLLLLRFAMLWIGIFLGLLLTGTAAINLVWTILFPLTMVTAAFAPPETMPAWLGFLAEWNPLSATIYATRETVRQSRGRHRHIVRGAERDRPGRCLASCPVVAIFAPLSAWRYRSLGR